MAATDPFKTATLKQRFSASREAVFKAWTEPDSVKKWFRPGGDNVLILDVEMDVRVGGSYRLTMGYETGESWSIVGDYQEVEPPKKLVYTWSYEEPNMDIGETLITVEFNDVGNSTEISLSHKRFSQEQARDAHLSGWEACFESLKKMF